MDVESAELGDDVLPDDPCVMVTQMYSALSPIQGAEDDDAFIDPITPTNSSNNLHALRQPGFFSSDTEVDDLHDFHDTTHSTPDHQTSPKSHFYFPGPLPSEPAADTIRILSYPPPHPEAKGKKERLEEKKQRKELDDNDVDGPETPQLERAGSAHDKEPRRDYSRRFYVPDVPLSLSTGSKPKSPEKSPPPPNKGNVAKRIFFQTSSSLSTAQADDVSTPVIVSKAPPHPFTKRIDSNTSMSSEVELAPTGSTSSSRATVEAKFQVRVPGMSEGEEVRVSGNDTVLGAWDVTKSIPMIRSSE